MLEEGISSLKNKEQMTPEEKASEMVKKFYNLRPYEVMDAHDRKLAYDVAKRSAIIAADMLIESSGFNSPGSFWHLVKQKIESQ